jgi:hypothetical protein
LVLVGAALYFSTTLLVNRNTITEIRSILSES